MSGVGRLADASEHSQQSECQTGHGARCSRYTKLHTDCLLPAGGPISIRVQSEPSQASVVAGAYGHQIAATTTGRDDNESASDNLRERMPPIVQIAEQPATAIADAGTERANKLLSAR